MHWDGTVQPTFAYMHNSDFFERPLREGVVVYCSRAYDDHYLGYPPFHMDDEGRRNDD